MNISSSSHPQSHMSHSVCANKSRKKIIIITHIKCFPFTYIMMVIGIYIKGNEQKAARIYELTFYLYKCNTVTYGYH